METPRQVRVSFPCVIFRHAGPCGQHVPEKSEGYRPACPTDTTTPQQGMDQTGWRCHRRAGFPGYFRLSVQGQLLRVRHQRHRGDPGVRHRPLWRATARNRLAREFFARATCNRRETWSEARHSPAPASWAAPASAADARPDKSAHRIVAAPHAAHPQIGMCQTRSPTAPA